MTSSVKIDAHCSEDKLVEVRLYNGTELIDIHKLENGEGITLYIYDERRVSCTEIVK